ncbi:prosaposin-like [Dysidea avara]|uniref:prosaposin-like n=1 Tax=Dysidea avara TaxID=196820 RepID=UPI00332E0196
MKVAMISSVLSVITLAGFVCCSDLPSATFSVSVESKQSGTLECVLCKLVMDELESVIKGNQTEEEIIQLVDDVCSELPSSIKAECKDFINDYGKEIIDALINDVMPSAVCTVIQLCSKVERKYPQGAVECDVCLFVAKYLDEYLDSNSTIEEIVKVMEDVCNVISSSLKKECTELLNTFGFEIVKQILNEITPKEICSDIKLCSSINELMGSSRCARGPAYWCSSHEAAVECNAEEYCKTQ